MSGNANLFAKYAGSGYSGSNTDIFSKYAGAGAGADNSALMAKYGGALDWIADHWPFKKQHPGARKIMGQQIPNGGNQTPTNGNQTPSNGNQAPQGKPNKPNKPNRPATHKPARNRRNQGSKKPAPGGNRTAKPGGSQIGAAAKNQGNAKGAITQLRDALFGGWNNNNGGNGGGGGNRRNRYNRGNGKKEQSVLGAVKKRVIRALEEPVDKKPKTAPAPTPKQRKGILESIKDGIKGVGEVRDTYKKTFPGKKPEPAPAAAPKPTTVSPQKTKDMSRALKEVTKDLGKMKALGTAGGLVGLGAIGAAGLHHLSKEKDPRYSFLNK